jgi:hypothetical protein
MNLADMTTAELTALVQGREARRTSAANLALWMELYARLPGDEGVAVGYADQLWGAEAVEALDRLLPSLLQRFPASVPLRYFWVRLPMIWGKPEEAARRCNIVMPKTPTDPNWVLVAYGASPRRPGTIRASLFMIGWRRVPASTRSPPPPRPGRRRRRITPSSSSISTARRGAVTASKRISPRMASSANASRAFPAARCPTAFAEC